MSTYCRACRQPLKKDIQLVKIIEPINKVIKATWVCKSCRDQFIKDGYTVKEIN